MSFGADPQPLRVKTQVIEEEEAPIYWIPKTVIGILGEDSNCRVKRSVVSKNRIKGRGTSQKRIGRGTEQKRKMHIYYWCGRFGLKPKNRTDIEITEPTLFLKPNNFWFCKKHSFFMLFKVVNLYINFLFCYYCILVAISKWNPVF